LGAPAGRVAAAGLGGWLVVVGTLSALGVVRDTALKPPGVLYIVIPVIAFVARFGVRSKRGGAVAAALPIWLLMGAQVFRGGVELGLHPLWQLGLVPRLMTYEGERACPQPRLGGRVTHAADGRQLWAQCEGGANPAGDGPLRDGLTGAWPCTGCKPACAGFL
jgi:hypothetical protein